jgi:TolB protein
MTSGGTRATRVALALWGAASPARAQEGAMRIQITDPGRSAYRIAVSTAPGDVELNATAAGVVSFDLRATGLFQVLDPRSFLDPAGDGMGIRVDEWRVVGAQGVLKLRATHKGSDARLEYRLFELAKPERAALDSTITGDPRSIRKLAHQVAAAVYRHYMGEDAFFLSRIAFSRRERRGRGDVWTADWDGHRQSRLTRHGSINILPAWAPSGSMLAFTSLLWSNPDLFVVSAAGGRPRRVSKYQGLNTGASFSPDGRSVAVTLSKDGDSEIYLIDLEGRIQKRLTQNPSIDVSPAFSPDGSQIAFVSNRSGSPQVWIMSSSGANQRRLTFQGNYNQTPRFSPRSDSALLAFTGRDERNRFDVFTLDLKSGETVRITQGKGDNQEPTWAPGGRLIAYSSSRGGIFASTLDGSHEVQLVRGAAETPAWSPWLK